MDLDLPSDWKMALRTELEQPYFEHLQNFVSSEYENHICYPSQSEIFNAFKSCAFNDVKVVIIGQDPYHGPNQANGLSFSVKDGVPHPPSLKNIFKEIEQDLNTAYPISGNLERWARQGVLMLNATLTVRAGEAGSHQKAGWEKFTNQVIKTLSDNKKDLVFLLWGGYAKNKIGFIDESKHTIFTSGHPSPLSANRGYWFGNKNFSKTNYQLQQVGEDPIEW